MVACGEYEVRGGLDVGADFLCFGLFVVVVGVQHVLVFALQRKGFEVQVVACFQEEAKKLTGAKASDGVSSMVPTRISSGIG